jgi:predicted phosphodiesterase
MRVAALYDIHGNLPALRAVLLDVERAHVDLVVVGGDVAAGPLPSETIDVLRDLGDRARFVQGNGDREVVALYDDPKTLDPAESIAASFAATRISRPQRDFLAGFVASVVIDLDDLGPARFCHGSPRSDTEIITTATSEQRLLGILAGVEERIVVCGHTHRQFERPIGRWRVVNAGSVGLPYEGQAGAYWALLGGGVSLRRTTYDLRQAVAELRESGYPDLEEFLEPSLTRPADPDEIARLFEGQALESVKTT